MTPNAHSILKSIAGKVVIGVAVVTMGVGAAAAAGADMPVLKSAGAPAGESEEEMSEGSGGESDEEMSEGSGDESDEPSGVAVEAKDEPNHGEVVSEFTANTELTGCAKGQATAAVARGDVDPTVLTPDELELALAPFVAKCDRADEDADDEDDGGGEEDGVGDDGVGTDAAWKGVRDEAKHTWHEAKQAWVDACGDGDGAEDEPDDADGDDADDDDDDDDGGMSVECRAMKDEVKDVHRSGRAEWHAARDAERDAAKADRSAERETAKAERESAKADRQAGKNSKGKGKNK